MGSSSLLKNWYCSSQVILNTRVRKTPHLQKYYMNQIIHVFFFFVYYIAKAKSNGDSDAD